jgi:hypothetical protein
VDEAVDGIRHLFRLVEIGEVAGVRDPFHLDVGALGRHICEALGWLVRIAVGLELSYRKAGVIPKARSRGRRDKPHRGEGPGSQ